VPATQDRIELGRWIRAILRSRGLIAKSLILAKIPAPKPPPDRPPRRPRASFAKRKTDFITKSDGEEWLNRAIENENVPEAPRRQQLDFQQARLFPGHFTRSRRFP
jgi:hypothetical protein